MKFILKNISAIPYAEVNLNGITLIAGENGSGKSTIEKAVSLAMTSLYNLSEFVQSERIATFNRTLKLAGNSLDVILKNISGAKRRHKVSDIEKLQSDFAEELAGSLPFKKEELQVMIKGYSISHAEYYSVNFGQMDNRADYRSWLAKTTNDIWKDASSSDDEIGKSSVTEAVRRFFADQIIRFDAGGEDSFIEMSDGSVSNRMFFTRITKSAKDVCSDLTVETAVGEQALYLSSPNVFDGLQTNSGSAYDALAVQNTVRYLLSPDVRTLGMSKKSVWNVMRILPSTLIEKNKNQEMTEKFYRMIEDTVGGHLEITASKRLQFVPSKGGRAVEMGNVSSGVKALSVLSYAIENGCVTDSSVLLLDEPEINLHPEWQLKYAEILVRMHKEMGIKIMVTTHSPYFVEAIEAYSEKYGIKSECSYYLSKLTGNEAHITDVTEDIRPIYSALAIPFEKLEKIEDGKE